MTAAIQAGGASTPAMITTPRLVAGFAALVSFLPLSPALAQPSVVDLGTAVRCSAAFGIISAEQQRGIASARAYPPLAVRGREFFVQTGARLMDEQKLSRVQVQSRMKSEVEKLQGEAVASADPAATVKGVMTPCLTLLDLTIPAK